jgi:catechol 2,3-dioxygenase-like lactoylglutathione lyase family enzyme
MKFRHAGIVISDLEKGLHFYKDLLGLKIVKEADETGKFIDALQGLKDVTVRTIKMLCDDGNMIELLYFKSHLEKPKCKNFYEIGASHVAFTVKNLDDEYHRLKNAGVKFNCPPKISPDGYAKVTFCKDSDGTLIELVEVLK